MTKKTAILTFFFIAIFSVIGYFYISKNNFAKNFLFNHEEANISKSANEQSKNVAASTQETIKVPIFIYHSVSPYYPLESKYNKRFGVEPDIFEKQMRYLKDNGYNVMPFDDLINHFSQNLSLPHKPVVLTFDDGWENQYKYAFPILKKYNMTATFFVFTNSIGRKHFLTWPEIKKLVDAGMTIGDHSKSHPYLYKITNENKLREEIVESKKILESNLGKKIDIFAYPFGHYNEEIITILKKNGFRAARTDGYWGVFHTSSDLFTLKSIEAENNLTKFIEALNINIKTE